MRGHDHRARAVAHNREAARARQTQSARADLLRRIGCWSEASVAYQRALDLVQNDPQRRYLARRIEEVTAEAT